MPARKPPQSEFDELIVELREDAAEFVNDTRPLFDPLHGQKALVSALRKMDERTFLSHLRGCGHNFSGSCNCDACGATRSIFIEMSMN